MPEIWDVEDPANKGKTPLCLVLVRDPTPYFKQVYKNEKFDVFKVLYDAEQRHISHNGADLISLLANVGPTELDVIRIS